MHDLRESALAQWHQLNSLINSYAWAAHNPLVLSKIKAKAGYIKWLDASIGNAEQALLSIKLEESKRDALITSAIAERTTAYREIQHLHSSFSLYGMGLELLFDGQCDIVVPMHVDDCHDQGKPVSMHENEEGLILPTRTSRPTTRTDWDHARRDHSGLAPPPAANAPLCRERVDALHNAGQPLPQQDVVQQQEVASPRSLYRQPAPLGEPVPRAAVPDPPSPARPEQVLPQPKLEVLSQHNLSILHCAGAQHWNADALSRIPLENQRCDHYQAGAQLATLLYNGCRTCTWVHEQRSWYEDDMNDVAPLAFQAVTVLEDDASQSWLQHVRRVELQKRQEDDLKLLLKWLSSDSMRGWPRRSSSTPIRQTGN